MPDDLWEMFSFFVKNPNMLFAYSFIFFYFFYIDKNDQGLTEKKKNTRWHCRADRE